MYICVLMHRKEDRKVGIKYRMFQVIRWLSAGQDLDLDGASDLEVSGVKPYCDESYTNLQLSLILGHL